MRSFLRILSSFVVLVAACAPVAVPRPASSVTGDVTIFAASSLTDAFTDLGKAFEQTNPGTRVTFNFASSSTLRTQLEQGARADVFASADTIQMDAARKANVLAGPDHSFARNRIVIIAPKDNPKRVASVRDLANPGLKFVTTAPSVPVGQYTLDMLEKASQDPAYGADFRERVEQNIVSREDNVRQVVAKVQFGEADAGSAYATDVTPRARDQVIQIAVPDSLQTIATYPIAPTRGPNAAGGEAFVNYVLGAQGQATLARWGFIPVNESPV